MKPLTLLSKIPLLLSLLLATLFLSGVGMPGQISVHAQDAGISDVLGALHSTGEARVLVLFYLDVQAAAVSEIEAIRQAQDAVLGTLPSDEFQLFHRYRHVPGVAGVVTAAGLDKLRNHPLVANVQLDHEIVTTLNESTPALQANLVRNNLGLTGRGVTVAVLDTGIDLNHPDLAASIVAQQCFNSADNAPLFPIFDECPPNDTATGADAMDEEGHGTHVSGIISSDGTAAPQGIAPDAQLVAVRVMNGNGRGHESDMIAGLDWVRTNLNVTPVQIINMSFRFDTSSLYAGNCDANHQTAATAVQNLVNQGVTLFAASGNEGSATGIFAPACLTGVIAVGATYDSDVGAQAWGAGCTDATTSLQTIVCFTNTTSEVDLLAPGALIDSTRLGGGQVNLSGTSMASPTAAAVAALLLEQNPALTPNEIEQILENSGPRITDARNNLQFPLINALNAITASATADLGISLTSSPNPAVAGEDLVYTITVTNHGPNGVFRPVVRNTLSPDVTYLANSVACDTSALPVLTCNLSTLRSGESQSYTVRVQVNSDIVAKAGVPVSLVTTASVAGAGTDPNPANDTFSITTIVLSKADLRIGMVNQPALGTAGEQLFYDVVITNPGPDLALDVVITDTLPPGLSFVTSTGACSVSSAAVVTCQLGNLPVGQERSLTIKTMVDPGLVAAAGGPTALTNTFIVGATSIDPQVENNRATPTTIVEELSDLRTTNDCKPDQPVAADKEATCTMRVENLGPSTARNVGMISTLLSDGAFRAGAVTPATCVVAASAADQSSTVTCAMGHLAKGERFTVVVPIIGDEAQDISNYLVVASDTPEREPSNNQATDSVSVRAWADLSIAFTANTTRAVVNTSMTLDLAVTNQGPSTAHDVVVTQLLPAGITFEQGMVVDSAGRCYMEPNATDNMIHCELGTLTSGATARIVITGTPTSEAVRKTLVTVTAQEDDPNPVNNLDEAEVNSFKYYQYLPAIQGDGAGTQADLVGSFTVNPNRQEFTAGEPVTITVTITNQGTAAAAPFMVDFYINPSVAPSSANVLWSRVCGMKPCLGIAWQVERSLAPGENITLTSTDDSFAAKFTAWPGWFAQGASDLYLYVDSYGLSSPSGAVVESNEENNRSELHGLLVTGVNPASMQSNDLPLLRDVE